MVLIKELSDVEMSQTEDAPNESDSSLNEEEMKFDTSNSEVINEEDLPSHFTETDKTLQNLGWADAMSKILKMNKPKKRKTLVLSRAKRDNEVKKPKEEPLDFEIDGKTKDIEPEIEQTQRASNADNSVKVLKKLKKKDWATKGHKRPSILDRDREKALSRIATKGVVQLFNAVRQHQKTMGTELKKAGSLEYKKDKVMKSIDKRSFLDVLMGNAKSYPVNDLMPDKPKEEDSKPPTWDILRDNFMMSAKLKNWDKGDVIEVKEETCT